MSCDIQIFKASSKKKYKTSLKLRYEVFVQEQEVGTAIEIDEFEKESTYFLCTQNKLAIATSRYRKTEKGIKIERFAVVKRYRRQHIGSILLGKMISKINPSKNTIYLNSQESAVPFYKKHNFEIVGDAFYEADIKHFKMIFKNP